MGSRIQRPAPSRGLLPSVVLLATIGSAPSALGDVEPFARYEADGWLVVAYRSGESDRFAHCTVGHPQNRRARFSLDGDYGLELHLAAQEGIGVGGTSVELLVDGRTIGTFPAALEGEELGIQLGRQPDLFAQVQRARSVSVRTPAGRIDTPLAAADRGLAVLVECVNLAWSFARGTANPYLPGHAPAYPSVKRRGNPTLERVYGLLRAAGLRDVRFVSGQDVGADDAALAWTSGRIVGVALLEARKERSGAELQAAQLGRFEEGCVGPPESRAPAPRAVGGYTLVHTMSGCRRETDTRVAVTTSILDDNEVVTLIHLGLAEDAQSLAATNRALGEVLEVLLRL